MERAFIALGYIFLAWLIFETAIAYQHTFCCERAGSYQQTVK